MSLTKDALQHIEQSHKTGTEVAEGHALVMGSDFQLADLGQFATKGLGDFTRYLGERAAAKTPVFIDRNDDGPCGAFLIRFCARNPVL